jgi:hypothetical protein
MLADVDSWHVGGDRPELAANFRWRFWLHVREVNVAGTAKKENKDARILPVRGRGDMTARERAPAGQIDSAQSEQPKAADAQTLSSREPRTMIAIPVQAGHPLTWPRLAIRGLHVTA